MTKGFYWCLNISWRFNSLGIVYEPRQTPPQDPSTPLFYSYFLLRQSCCIFTLLSGSLGCTNTGFVDQDSKVVLPNAVNPLLYCHSFLPDCGAP